MSCGTHAWTRQRPCAARPVWRPGLRRSRPARFLRAAGAVAYGFTIHDGGVNLDSFGSMFHGDDEHVSVASLGVAVDVYVELARRLCG